MISGKNRDVAPQRLNHPSPLAARSNTDNIRMQREGKRCEREKGKGEGCEGSEGGSAYLSPPKIRSDRRL